MIPKKIHYVWFGDAEMNTTLKNCLASWEKMLPDYEIKCWNERNSPLDYRFMKQMIRHKKWAMISDYIRIYSLYHEGGIYLDTDVEVIKSLDPFLQDGCFLGFQQEKPSSHWVNCAVMGAENEHTFLKDCLDLFDKSQRRDNRPFVGPDISTLVLRDYGLKEYGNQDLNGVKIYEYDYFYPYHFTESYNKECITDNTHCIHHWQISWKKKGGMKDWIIRSQYRIARFFTIVKYSIFK